MPALVRAGFPSSRRLLSHILEDPGLVAAVRELSPPILGRVVESVGLEDAGELVALASTEQLAAIFDEDLWRGTDDDAEERFDGARFALWLHAFGEAGDTRLVERLLALPIDFLALAVARLVLVVDIDQLGIELSEGGDEVDNVEKALESSLYEEWEEFRIIARDATAWDDVIHALLALDREHHGLLRRILERVAAASSSFIEDNGGLCAALTSDEMLESDARADRDDRRAKLGFVSPADARAFLKLALRDEAAERDPITRAYFRELERNPPPGPARRVAAKPDERADPGALLAVLERARVIERTQAAPRPALPPALQASAAVVPAPSRLLDAALTELALADRAGHAERLEEIAFVANVLAAATASLPERLRPIEALEGALAIADLGLVQALEVSSDRYVVAVRLVAETGIDVWFRRGLHALARERGSGNELEPVLGHVVSLARASGRK